MGMTTLAIGVVKYGDSVSSIHIRGLIAQWFPNAKVFIINNRKDGALEGEFQGSNSGHEFSGYLELLTSMGMESPIVLLNDTMFKNHVDFGWFFLVRSVLNRSTGKENTIYGDLRYDGNDLIERPNPFLASWIFVINEKRVAIEFQRVLQLLLSEPLPHWSQQYEAFLEDWLNGAKWNKGWHRYGTSAEMLHLKKRNIFWEHQISAKMQERGVCLRSLGTFYPFTYKVIRLLDRLNTAIYRWVGLIWNRRSNFD